MTFVLAANRTQSGPRAIGSIFVRSVLRVYGPGAPVRLVPCKITVTARALKTAGRTRLKSAIRIRIKIKVSYHGFDFERVPAVFCKSRVRKTLTSNRVRYSARWDLCLLRARPLLSGECRSECNRRSSKLGTGPS